MRKNKRTGSSLLLKILIAFLSVDIVFGAVLTTIFYFSSKDALLDVTEMRTSQYFESIRYQYDNEIGHHLMSDLHLLAANTVLEDFMMSSESEREIRALEVEKLFRQYISSLDSYLRILFADYQGQELVKVDNKGADHTLEYIGDNQAFQDVQAEQPGSTILEGPYVDADGHFFLSIWVNIIDQDIGKFGGALVIDYSLEDYIHYIDNISLFGENPLWLFSKEGDVLKQPISGGPALNPRPYLSPEPQKDLQIIKSRDGLIIYQDLFTGLEDPLLRVAISVPSSLLLKDIRKILGFFIIVFILSLFPVFAAAYYLARSLSLPIVELSQAANSLAGGDLSTQVETRASGEIRELVNSFNRMALDLKETTVSKAEVDNIINSLNEALIVTTAEGRIVRSNAIARDLLGFNREELLEKSLKTLFVEDSGTGSTLVDEIAERGAIRNLEKSLLTKNGRKIPVLLSASVLTEQADTPTGIVCVAQDITERKWAEGKLAKRTEELARSNAELEQFAYVASHDLQEPLRKVTAFGDRLHAKYGKCLEGQGLDYLNRMQDAARRMQVLINDLLTFSRVTTKTQPFTPVDLGSIAREVLSDLEILVEKTSGRVEIDGLPTIDADPLQMRQVFQNLIGNALKFYKKDVPPLVRINSESVDDKDGKMCRISIRDNGIGFEEKYTEQIFGIFQRLHGRSEYEGSGVGLAVCRKIVERHGGSITARSTPGQGATFIITMPFSHENHGNR